MNQDTVGLIRELGVIGRDFRQDRLGDCSVGGSPAIDGMIFNEMGVAREERTRERTRMVGGIVVSSAFGTGTHRRYAP